jgi:hypothetical protein
MPARARSSYLPFQFAVLLAPVEQSVAIRLRFWAARFFYLSTSLFLVARGSHAHVALLMDPPAEVGRPAVREVPWLCAASSLRCQLLASAQRLAAGLPGPASTPKGDAFAGCSRLRWNRGSSLAAWATVAWALAGKLSGSFFH